MATTEATTRACPALAGCPAAVAGSITAHGAGEPGPLYTHLRRYHPVFHDPELDVWVISRHNDIDTVLRDAGGTFSTALGYLPLRPLCPQAQAVLGRSAAVPVLSSLDPPHHTRFRRQMTAVFPSTDSRVNHLQSLLQEEARHAAQRFAGRLGRTGDLVDHWARPLATAALGRMTGIPPADQQAVQDQAAALTHLVWGSLDDTGQIAAAHALNDLFTYCHTLAEQRTHSPGDDLVSGWLTHQDTTGQPFTTREVASTLMEVLITNAEITPRLLANTLHRLLTTGTWNDHHPAQRLPAAIKETLRHDPPLAGWLRNTTRAVELSGVRIPAGARLLLLLASAARDEQHPTTDPDSFNPDRTDSPPLLAFGAGIHYCPGAPYARHLAHQGLTALARSCPDLTLTDAHAAHPDHWPLNTAVRSPDHLLATW
ncbi:cytochrome P450 [Streptomyces sp. SudanB182_2057]|uniref:cytochrome P450 n=1 Tax=Streptomyces sp. SudanB182_2057 TaxID=3035281 RepID=UPI003F57BDE6